MPDAYLDAALADFSGYLAIDEVYDGPFCVLCVVDNRKYNRLACSVLDRSPRSVIDRSGYEEQLVRSETGVGVSGSVAH